MGDGPLKEKKRKKPSDKPVVALPKNKGKGKAKRKLKELSEGEAWPHSDKGIIKGGKGMMFRSWFVLKRAG